MTICQVKSLAGSDSVRHDTLAMARLSEEAFDPKTKATFVTRFRRLYNSGRLGGVSPKGRILQEKVAEELELSQATVSRLFTGRRQPTTVHLMRIAARADVTIDWLLGLREPKVPDNMVDLQESVHKAVRHAQAEMRSVLLAAFDALAARDDKK